jgi:hypothetical protein
MRNFLFFSILILFLSAHAERNLELLGTGAPQNIQDKKLVSESYVPVNVVKLKSPRLIWANLPLLKEMGFQVPSSMDKATEKILLDQLGWVTVDDTLNTNDVDLSQTKTMYSDFYGGDYVGSNTGSARAASAGEIQIKGVGITPHLSRLYRSPKHTARSTIHEAIKDAIWGEILNNELPFGANRLVAILDRGGSPENGEPQILEVRQDPVRMGHFLLNNNERRDNLDTERRLHNLSANLVNALPLNSSSQSDSYAQKIFEGMKEYARRIGHQYGQMYMLKLYHGATSQSNIEINGRMIDFGTTSSQPGYRQIQFLDFIDPFGKTNEIKSLLIASFPHNIRLDDELENALKRQFADKYDWRSHFAQTMRLEFLSAYDLQREQAVLKLIGIPSDFIGEYVSKYKTLTHYLISLTESDLSSSPVTRLTELDKLSIFERGRLSKLINQLTETNPTSFTEIVDAFKNFIPSESKTSPHHLAQMYFKLYNEAEKKAIQQGVSKKAFRILVYNNSKFFNRPLDQLYMPEFRQLTKSATQEYLNGHHRSPEMLIKKTIGQSLRSINELSWHQSPVKIIIDNEGQKAQIFDAKTNTLFIKEYQTRDKHTVRSTILSCRKIYLQN